jgi:RHS repeat-associated protein
MIKEETARAQGAKHPSTCEWRHLNDPDRMLRTETRQTAVQITRTPDTAGRLDTVAIPGGLIDYDYYASGLPSGSGKTSDIRGPYGTDLHFTYDGMLTTGMTWSGAVTGNVSWAYNTDFNKILETVSGATSTAQAVFGYDADQLLTCASPTTCTPAGSDALRLTRHPQHGLITAIALGSTSETITYNNFGELARQTARYTGVTTPLVDITYHTTGAPRDKLGRIAVKTEAIGGLTADYQYFYDAQRRLTDVMRNGELLEHFEYDQNGNRTLGYNADSETEYTGTYDSQDRLLTYGPWTFTYTTNGELETKTNTVTGDDWAFQYDALGNLLSVGLPNGDLVEYLVDGLGRRVGKKKNGVLLKQWIYRDALKPVAELDGAGALMAEFVYGSKGNVPDYVRRGGSTYRVISDHLGSPRYVVNVANSANVPFRADYSSFGEVTGTGLDWMPFGFAGGIYDADSGLVRFGARDYESMVGRWTTKDPIVWFGAQTNLYAYVDGDPLNFFDPTGLLVDVVYSLSRGELSIVDSTTGQHVSLGASSGGRPRGDPIPVGRWEILERAGKADWFRLDAVDSRLRDDVHQPTGRNAFRLHGPGNTIGCVAASDRERWQAAAAMIRGTRTVSVDDNSVPWWGVGPAQIIKFGTLTVIK